MQFSGLNKIHSQLTAYTGQSVHAVSNPNPNPNSNPNSKPKPNPKLRLYIGSKLTVYFV